MIQESVNIESIYLTYQDALLAGDQQRCRLLVEEMLQKGMDVRTLYVEIFQRTLYQTGELWERNQLSVARCQLVTSITESLLALAHPQIFSARHNGRKAVVACTANQYHQIGGRMVADILELNGWDCHFLRGSVPLSELLSLLDDMQPDLLCFSLSVYSALPHLLELLDHVKIRFPELPIIVGGQAFRHVQAVEQVTAYQGVRHVDSIAAWEQLVRDW